MSDEYQKTFLKITLNFSTKTIGKKALKTISILSDYIGPLNSLKH
ncbi:hypothetical protein CM15mP35_00300 [bacterium]|nr:MAG: hypothetical protein CM15mP35_00300 [bacterium]